jgi:SAM-dependent methyltransferase
MSSINDEMAHAERLAAYDQNSQHFRALNGLMWQIPLIGMTLTGGLWFGVTKAESSPHFQLALLLLAGVGNIGLIVILQRLRFIMGQYLIWLEEFGQSNFVSAKDGQGLAQPYMVRYVFQLILLIAAMVSFALMIETTNNNSQENGSYSSVMSQSYYDEQATRLAESYEALVFEDVHPFLVKLLYDASGRRILDVGSGTGRDAAWMINAGHSVTAVEPSEKMLSLAKTIHANLAIEWKRDSLPNLETIPTGRNFDVIVLSAVWMHVHPSDRSTAFSKLVSLLDENGTIYMTLRIGPSDPERSIFEISIEEVADLAKDHGLEIHVVTESPDLLSRDEIEWKAVTFTQRNP